MKRKVSVFASTGILLLITSIILWVVFSKINHGQRSNDPENLAKLLELIEVADSVRSSIPDSAMANYNKVIALMQNPDKDKTKLKLLANSYIGIAYVHTETGNYTLAFRNDSIAMVHALESGDKETQAKAYIVRGITHYNLANYEEALMCYEEAEKLAIEIEDLEIQAKIFSNRAMIYFYLGESQKTIDGFTHALSIGRQLNNEPLIAGNYMNLAIVYSNLSKNDSVFIFYERALALFQKLNDKNGALRCYLNLGNAYYGFSNYVKAIEYYQLVVKNALEMDDKSNLAKGYNNLGDVYIHLGDYDTAAELLFKSIKIKEQINEKASLARGYFGLGKLYFYRKDYAKSLPHFQKSLEINQEIKDPIQIGSSLNSIASIYGALNKNDSAIASYNEVMETYEKIDYIYGISNLCINLADEYRILKKYDLAEKYLLQAMQLKTEMAEEEGIATVNRHLAKLYLKKSEGLLENQKNSLLKKAEEAALKSYKTATRIGTLPVRRDVSGDLKKIYQMQGRYRDALEYFEIYNTLTDSLLNKDKIEALTFAEARWNVEKKQQEIDNLEETHKLNQEIIHQKITESSQQKIIIWIVIALFVLTVISMVIATLYLRKRRDALYQKQLAKMTALRMQNARNAMSPHFFFNVLATISGLSANPEILKAKLKSLSLLLRKVIENIDRTAVTLDEELAAVKAFVDLSSDKIPEPFNVEYIIEEGTKLHGLVPAMMIQIPVENAIKHGLMPLQGEKKLTISVTDFEGYQQITVADNGIGLTAAGSNQSTGTGTGLKVLMQTIHLLNLNNQKKIRFSVNERQSHLQDTRGTAVDIQIPHDFNYTL
jgi:tetratricopeptide (TPR) repeat protein